MLALRLNAIHVRYSARWYDVVKASSIHSIVGSHCTQSIRQYSGRQKEQSAIAESKFDTAGEISTEVLTVKEAAKTAFNTGIILTGLGVTATLLGFVFYELFSSNSWNNIYHDTVKRCIANPKIQDTLGQPVSGYKEGRDTSRRLFSAQEYQRDGGDYLLLQFYLKGTRRRGTIYMEMKKGSNGIYQTEVMVLLPEFTKIPMIVEDNRVLETPSDISDTVMESMNF